MAREISEPHGRGGRRTMSVAPGRILFLQGASSSGKSTLSKALQRTLDECWWQLEADDISHMWPMWQPPGWWEPRVDERPHPSWDKGVRLAQWLEIYWGCLVTIARSGANVIAVGGWLKTEWLVQSAHAFDGIEAICVGVHCPIDELERREMARGDRGLGYARSQIDIVHEHAPYDLDVDTHMSTVADVDVVWCVLV